MARPRISVVIAAYNSERFIGETLRSIRAQSFEDWECIVVDDGSKDGTLEIVEAFAREDGRFRGEARANGGSSAARNHGFSVADAGAAYVSFMDHDDLWAPDALRILIEEAEAHPEAVGAHGFGRCVDEHGALHEDGAYARHEQGRFFCDAGGRPKRMGASEPTSFRSLWFSAPFPPGLVLTRRSAYEKVGLFDETMCPMEDWDMLIRLSRVGGFRYVEKAILSYRRHGGNLSSRSTTVSNEKLRELHHKTFFSAENGAEQRRVLRENWRATQLFHLRQRLHAAANHVSKGAYMMAAGAVAGAPVQIRRLARGYPRLAGI